MFFLFSSGSIRANELNFTQISTRDGLSQNTVRTLIEDNTGFIWAGTMDGLNRYDGNIIKTYRPEAGNLYSLSDYRIKDIYKDKHGDLWIKTYENIFQCYNSVEDRFVYPDPDIHIPDGYTYTNLFEDTDGNIWLWGGRFGLRYIYRTAQHRIFEKILIGPESYGNVCNFLFEDSHKNIWTAGIHGLISISRDLKITYHSSDSAWNILKGMEYQDKLWFITEDAKMLEYNKYEDKFKCSDTGIDAKLFVGITSSGNNRLIIPTHEKGIYEYDILTDKIIKPEWTKDPDLNNSVEIIIDANRNIWFYNGTGNIWYFNHITQQAKKMRLIPERIMKTVDMERYNIHIDATGLIWITTYGNGLFCYHPENDQLNHYKNRPYSNSPASDYLLDITEDRFGNIWIGSEYAGIIRVVKNTYPLQIIRPEKETALGRNNNIRAVREDSNGRIWVGAKNGNLYVYDQYFENMVCLKEDINPYCLAELKGKYMWVGTKGNGVFLYDLANYSLLANFRHENENNHSLSYDAIFSILIDKNERVWLGSFSGGLNLFENTNNYQTPGFRRFIQDEGNKSYIRDLFQDSKNRIWVGTSEGVLYFNPDELIENPEAYTSFKMDLSGINSLSSNDIKTIFEDKEGTIWIGSAGGGLNYFVDNDDPDKRYFKTYTTENGLANNFVSGIIEYENNLWISTENGISRFIRENQTFINYHFSENTYGNHFNENAKFLCKNGTMLWGSLDGLLLFKPEFFITERSAPEVKLTGFYIDGDANIAKPALKKSITFTDKMRLNYRQNTFTIEFASLILHNPGKNKYSFILENYEKKWSDPNHINYVTYKNLSPGKYIFKVKGSNHDGVWNDDITHLDIIITPPIWKSTFAYIFYFMAFIGLLYMILFVINRMNVLNNAVEMEKQLTNHKLRFFTNISHEFRTPLTLIQGVIEKLNDMNEIPASIEKYINTLKRNSSQLSNLIDELLEFRKIQNSISTLSLSRNDIITFAKDILSGFIDMAGQKEITIDFRSNKEIFYMFFDSKKVDKIINNLLSNSLKFTGKYGKIEMDISIDEKNKTCLIRVKDNGIGIPKEKHDLIFSRFMQINFSSSGTRVGLSLVKEFTEVHKGRVWYESNPEGGSIFYVELSTNENIYDAENFITGISVVENINTDLDSRPLINEENIIKNTTGKEYKLLIIEDNIEVTNFLLEEFQRFYCVYTAENGKIGVDKAIDINPDIIICDIMMPEMDGFDVTRTLKNEFQTSHIPIILLTAHSSLEHQVEGIESGADAYIHKPFSIRYLITRVHKLIEQREILKKRFSAGEDADKIQLIKNKKDKDFYELIDRILEDNYTNSKFNVDMFAERANMSRTAFYKKIKGITGISPNDLIKLKRMKKGADLLKHSDMNIAQISYEIGLEDPFYFSKCFKAQYNYSSSQFRQNLEKAEF